MVVLLLAAQGQLSAFVELLCVALSRNVHHDDVFTAVVEIVEVRTFLFELVNV